MDNSILDYATDSLRTRAAVNGFTEEATEITLYQYQARI